MDQTNQDKTFVSDLKRRVAETRRTRWWRFGIVCAIFVAWVAWLGSWWVLIFLPLLFDIYITGYIPFTWWKQSKNKTVQMVMSWVDAILYALILVYFVFTFIGQNYQIPSSSLEKTLLTGDYLWVNKMAYGPRVPNTPIHFPLVQNTLPWLNCRSYTEWPLWNYKRLAGFSKIKSGDIVVFNLPAGDTIAVARQNPDYYNLVQYMGDSVLEYDLEKRDRLQSLGETTAMYDYRDQIGRQEIASHPERFGEVMWRPVDRRENYVKRAVGLPGDTLEMRAGEVYINGRRQPWPENAQFKYIFRLSAPMSDGDWEALGVAIEDRQQGRDEQSYIFAAPLTNAMVNKLKGFPSFVGIEREPSYVEHLFPARWSEQQGWTKSDYGPLWIPAKGKTIALTEENWLKYNRAIRNYEGHHDAYFRDGKAYIDGRYAPTYTFAMDYYYMVGDNRDNSLDSRYWGYVPEDHVVGRPEIILISFDKDKSMFNGGIRWNRIFKSANPGF